MRPGALVYGLAEESAGLSGKLEKREIGRRSSLN
jgi:hypothetical protein